MGRRRQITQEKLLGAFWQGLEVLDKSTLEADHVQYSAQLKLAARPLTTEADTIGSAQAAYAWMPTMLRRCDWKHLHSVLTELGCDATWDQIFSHSDFDRATTNGRFVGTSKVLHFRWPNEIPIFDSVLGVKLGVTVDQRSFREATAIMHSDLSRQAAHDARLVLPKVCQAWTDIRILERGIFGA